MGFFYPFLYINLNKVIIFGGFEHAQKMTTPTLQKKQQIHEDNDVSTTTSSKPKERRIVTWTQEVSFSLS